MPNKNNIVPIYKDPCKEDEKIATVILRKYISKSLPYVIEIDDKDQYYENQRWEVEVLESKFYGKGQIFNHSIRVNYNYEPMDRSEKIEIENVEDSILNDRFISFNGIESF